MHKLKDLATSRKTATFERYRNNALVYSISGFDSNGMECVFEFEVPVEDLSGATVNNHEKASVFMKWIRIALKAQHEAALEELNNDDNS